MPWFAVDDQFAFHAKAVAAGNEALGMWVRAGSWCQQQGGTGVIPEGIVVALGGVDLAEKLVRAGLWARTPSGFKFHEWDEYQKLNSAARNRSAKRAEAGRLGGKRSGEVRRAAKQNEANTTSDLQRFEANEANSDLLDRSAAMVSGTEIASELRESEVSTHSRERAFSNEHPVASAKNGQNPAKQNAKQTPKQTPFCFEAKTGPDQEEPKQTKQNTNPLPNTLTQTPTFDYVEASSLVTYGGGVASGTARVCPRHPNGNPTGEACGGCADARRAIAADAAEALEAAKRARSAEVREQATTKAAAIAGCGLCDDNGYRGVVVCDHVDHAPAAARGRAKIQAELDAIAARKSA